MRGSNAKLASVVIYFCSITLYVAYLLTVRWDIYLPVSLFWVLIVFILGAILYQTLLLKLTSSFAKVILLEISITAVVFHLIYQIPYYGLRGSDAYIDLASAKAILDSGYIRGVPELINVTSYFPIIHILGAQLALITNTGILTVAKWFPSFIALAFIPLLYLLIKSIFKEETIALLATLLFACLQHQILFNSLFIRETIALMFAVCCLYLYFTAKSSAQPATRMVFAILFFIVTVLAHPLTSFMLLTLLVIDYTITKLAEGQLTKRGYVANNRGESKVTVTFLVFAFVGIICYWVYVVASPVVTLVNFVRDLFNIGQWGLGTYAEAAGINISSIQTLRGYILFYGFYSFSFIFGVILLYQVVVKTERKSLKTYSFTFYLFLCGAIGLIQMYVVSIAGSVFPDRLLMYGWLLAFAPLVVSILHAKHKLLRNIGISLLGLYLVFNIYTIEPTAWEAGGKGVIDAPSIPDYALANTIDFSNGSIVANSYVIYAIYDISNNLGFSAIQNVDLNKYKWVVIDPKALAIEKKAYLGVVPETITEMTEMVESNVLNRNKIYQSDYLLVFTLRY